MAVGNTKVIQVTNIAPQATKDQMQVLFGYLGKIEDIRLYPTIRDVSCPVQSRICYIKFVDASTIPIAQHMTNTVFIDRALIVIPLSNGEIPDEYYALEMTRNGTVVPGLAVSDPKLPPHVVNSVHGSGEDQVILTTDTNLDSDGLPPYPPLPANFDSAKIEETRRTIVLLNYDPAITSNEIIEFFSAAGEVKYLRTCKRDSDDSANMLVEFSDQPSVINALKMNGMELKGKPVDIQHATQPITKPQAKSNEAAQKEIEEAMSRFKEAQNMINASIEPVIGMLTKDKRSSRRSRSRSRGRRRRSRSRSRSRKRSRSRRRRSTSRRRTRSRDRKRRSKSRSRKRSSSRSRRSVSRSSKSRRSRSKSRTRSRRKSKERSSRAKSRDRRRKSKERDRSRERKRSRDRKSRDRDASKERDKEKDKEKSSSESKEKRSEKDRSEKDRSDKEKSDKDKSEKDKSDKDKSEKDRSDKDKSEKDRSDKDKSEKDRSDKEKSDKESSVDVPSEKRVSRSRSRSKRRSRSRDRKTRDRKRSRSRGSRRRSPSPRVSRKRKSRSRSKDRDRKREKKSDRRDRDRKEKDRKSRSRSRSRRSPSRRSTRSHSKVPRNYDEEERGFDSVKEKEVEPAAPEKGSPEKSDNMDISNSP